MRKHEEEKDERYEFANVLISDGYLCASKVSNLAALTCEVFRGGRIGVGYGPAQVATVSY